MNILLDTHTFLWWITDSSRLSEVARNLMINSNNNLYWSAASSWETAIKYELGRLPLPEKPEITVCLALLSYKPFAKRNRNALV